MHSNSVNTPIVLGAYVLIVGENIADNGGLKAAYNAYIQTKSVDEIDIYQLPGINMTHRQLFFVSFAQVRFVRHIHVAFNYADEIND